MLNRSEIQSSEDYRKEVSMEPPQYNGGLLGLQKREYLARTESLLFKKNLVDLITI
jgi:hypothetical protein